MRCRAGGGSLHEERVFQRKLFLSTFFGPKRSLVPQGERHQYDAGERAQLELDQHNESWIAGIRKPSARTSPVLTLTSGTRREGRACL